MKVKQFTLLAHCAGLALGSAILFYGPVAAGDQHVGADPVHHAMVTGSRIAQPEGGRASPMIVITREQIKQSGLTSLGMVLQELPIAGSALNPRFNGGGNGQTHLDLRNLGAARVLVLLNGRRFISGPGGVVDLNNIPLAIVQRVEIAKDGGSPVYGSGAITGVVNVITRDDLAGLEADAYIGQFESENDGESQAFDFSVGSRSRRGWVFFNASHVKADPVLAGDRDISSEPLFGTGLAFGSSFTPQGRFGAVALGSFGLTTDPGANVTGPGGLGAAAFRDGDFSAGTPGSGADRYNVAPDQYLLTPQERTSIYTRGAYDVTDEVKMTVEASYHRRDSAQQLAPAGLGLGLFGSGVGARTGVAADNRFNPFGIDLQPDSFLLARRLVEAGPQVFRQQVDSYRFGLGLSGAFDLGQRQLGWDVSYLYSDLRQVNGGSRRVNMARVGQALSGQACRDDAYNDGCVELNLFGGQGPDGSGTITPDMLDYILFTENSSSGSELRVYQAGVTGELFEMPAGPLGFAAGYESRQEEGRESPDALVQAGLGAGNVSAPVNGSFQAEGWYMELAVPLLTGVRGARRLDVLLATRRSDYDTFGDTTSSKAGIHWQPFDDLRLHATWSEGFRAPPITDLFQASFDVDAGLVDPCNGVDTNGDGMPDTNPGLPGCAGIPGSYRQPVGIAIGTTVGSNPQLGPETADSITAGLAYKPVWAEGLEIAVDYYRIDLDEVISRFSAQSIVDLCAVTGRTLCNLVSRDVASGALTGLQVAPANLGGLETEGVDLQVRYALPETDWGDWTLNWMVAYQGANEQRVADPGTGGFDRVSRVGQQFGSSAYPRFRSQLAVQWRRADWEASWGLKFIQGTDERCGLPASFGFCNLDLDGDGDPGDGRRIGSTTYHDVQVSYFPDQWDTRLTLGVRNLFDKGPPLSTATSFNRADYRIPGAFPYLRVSVDF